MSEKNAKRNRRMIQRYRDQLIYQSFAQTLREPWYERWRLAFRLILGA